MDMAPESHQLSGDYVLPKPEAPRWRSTTWPSMSSAIDDKPHVIVVINTSPALPRGPGPVSVPADADQRLSNDANQCALKLQVSGMITDLTTHHCP